MPQFVLRIKDSATSVVKAPFAKVTVAVPEISPEAERLTRAGDAIRAEAKEREETREWRRHATRVSSDPRAPVALTSRPLHPHSIQGCFHADMQLMPAISAPLTGNLIEQRKIQK